MNIIILAAGDKGITHKNKIIPRPLLPLKNGTSIIENLLSHIYLLTKGDCDIYLAINKSELWSKPNIEKLDTKIKIIWINNSDQYNNAKTVIELIEFLSYEPIQNFQDTLFIDGDLVIPRRALLSILSSKSKITLLTRRKFNYSEKSIDIFIEGGRLLSIGNNLLQMKDINILSEIRFSGILKVSTIELVGLTDYLRKNTILKSYIEGVNKFIDKFKIELIDIDGIDVPLEKKLIGGSFAKLQINKIVRKEVGLNGKVKLLNEIEWISKLPIDLAPYFPEIVRSGSDNSKTFYEMIYYDFPNLREIIFDFKSDKSEILDFIQKLLVWLRVNLYNRTISESSSSWVKEKHFERYFERLLEIQKSSARLSTIIKYGKIILNGKVYINTPILMLEMLRMKDLHELILPARLSMVHGDLHPQNILVRSLKNYDFILADPRGELEGSDLFYDLGKIWHSFNGKYDLLHTGNFELNEINNVFNLSWNRMDLVNKYDSLLYELEEIVPKVFNDYDRDTLLLRIKFNEVIHFASVSLFHLDGSNDTNATAMYLIGVKLINEFYEEFNIRKRFNVEESFIDINDSIDYHNYLGEQNEED
jgi:hypothetical protein